ncbi:MAG: alpha-ketoacid dehydrogenase subunit beta [DPANN group archaeon]|nr:alpha-ketoacid dehydrogenase subunit beta [DPANN group archaeon]
MATLTLVQAINLALRLEMKRDKKVIVLGEDVGVDGGVFRVTEGLLKLYGPERVIDTPLAETGIIGSAIGMAVGGIKPVAEAQFDGFSIPMIDQLYSHAARIRNRSRGRFTCPLVLRIPCGGGIRALEHHSESPETFFCHIPGLKVVVPSTPYDAKGLLSAAIRDSDPVIYLEPKKLYRAIKEEVPENDFTVPIGKAIVRREGTDVTLIAWGAMVQECLKAAEGAKASCEVIDLRSLKPLDIETITASVQKTGRVIVVHEAPKTCGFGAELSALIQEKSFLSLKAPVTRVTGLDIIIPLPKLEHYYFPSADKIAKAIENTINY